MTEPKKIHLPVRETQALAAVGSLCAPAIGVKRFQDMVLHTNAWRTVAVSADDTHAIRVTFPQVLPQSVLIPGGPFTSLVNEDKRARAVLEEGVPQVVLKSDGKSSTVPIQVEPSGGSAVFAQVHEIMKSPPRAAEVRVSLALLRRVLDALGRASFPDDVVTLRVPLDEHMPVLLATEPVAGCGAEALIMPMARRTR